MSTLVRRESPKRDAFTQFFGTGFPTSRDDFFRPFEQQLDSILDHFEGYGFKNLKNNSGYPRLDVISHDNNFVVEVAIPGVDPSDVKVEIHPGEADRNSGGAADTLVISGKMKGDYVREGAHYHVRELSRRAFTRGMLLPNNIQGDPHAVFNNGMLTLTWKLIESVDTRPKVRVIPVTNAAIPSLDPV